MIAHGRADKAVNIGQSMELSDHLKQAQVPVRMIVVNGGHEFEGLSNQEVAAIIEQEFDFIKHPRGR
jgi:dipeptidyl aminopeptidase/acylaminoacyl peptidase